MRLMRKD